MDELTIKIPAEDADAVLSALAAATVAAHKSMDGASQTAFAARRAGQGDLANDCAQIVRLHSKDLTELAMLYGKIAQAKNGG